MRIGRLEERLEESGRTTIRSGQSFGGAGEAEESRENEEGEREDDSMARCAAGSVGSEEHPDASVITLQNLLNSR